MVSEINQLQKVNPIKFSSKSYIFLLFLFVILVFIRDLNIIGIPPFFFTFFCGVVFVILKPSYIIGFFMFIVPFKGGLGFNQIVLLFILIYLFKNYKSIQLSVGVIFPYLIAMLELFHFFHPNSDFLLFMRWVVFIIAVTIIVLDRNLQIDVVVILKSFCIGALFAGVIVLIATINQYGISNILNQALRLGELNTQDAKYHTYFDANELGMYLDVAIAIILTLFINNKINGLWTYILVICMVIIGFTTLSKAFVFTLFLTVILYFLLTFKKLILNIRSHAVFIVALVISGYIIVPYIKPLINNFKARFEMSDQSNGRIDIMVNYYNTWSQSIKSILIGDGLRNYSEGAWMGASSHNATQEVLLSWGIIGLVLVIFWFIIMYRNQKYIGGNKKFEGILLLPLITLLFYVQSLQFFKLNAYILLLIVVFLTLQLNRDVENS
jgi:hypothetical protein